MSLFLVTSTPLILAFILVLRWALKREPRGEVLLSISLKGLLSFLPGYILLAIIRGIAGSSLTGFTLYISVLVRDHLVPLVIAAGAFALWQGKLEYPASDDGIVLTAFAFFSGFYALFGIADFFALYGNWGAENLFLLPLLRIAAILSLSMIAPRFYRFQGSYAATFICCAAALCLPLALVSWIYAVNVKALAWILGGAAFCGAAGVFIMKFPEVFSRSNGGPNAARGG
jgi:hypothetical protein